VSACGEAAEREPMERAREPESDEKLNETLYPVSLSAGVVYLISPLPIRVRLLKSEYLPFE